MNFLVLMVAVVAAQTNVKVDFYSESM